MLSQIQTLVREAEGRYATDAELQFLEDYTQSFPHRLRAYQNLRKQERSLIQQSYNQLKAQHPELFPAGQKEAVRKWQRDTIWILRYSAVAMLLDDVDSLRDRILLWFQTIMRAFGVQKTCYLTYSSLKTLAPQLMGEADGALLAEVLEVNRELFDLPELEA
jgi:nitric oxide reductase activation protein